MTDLNKYQIQVLKLLNDSKGDQNMTDEVIARALKIPKSDVQQITAFLQGFGFIYSDSTDNQIALGQKAWKVFPDGEMKINMVVTDSIEKKADHAESTAKEANGIASDANRISKRALTVSSVGLLVALAVCGLQGYQITLLKEQNSIQEQALRESCKIDTIYQLNPVVSKTEQKDSVTN